jgi:hypothetical protein
MARNETLPINHSTGSHILHTAGGAASGGIKGMLAGAGVGWGVIAGTAALVGGLLGGFGVAAVAGGIAAVAVPVSLLIPGVNLVAFPLLAAVAAPFAGVGAWVGGFMGAGRGHEQVRQDRAAAHMVDAEVGAMQAQAMAMQAQAQMTAQSRGGVPSTILADSAEYQGRVAAAQQLQRA